MSKTQALTLTYRIAVFYRFAIAFVLGFICTVFFCISLTHALHLIWPKAESIFLAAFCAILFYAAFVIISFCIQSLIKLTLYTVLLSGLFLLFVQGLS